MSRNREACNEFRRHAFLEQSNCVDCGFPQSSHTPVDPKAAAAAHKQAIGTTMAPSKNQCTHYTAHRWINDRCRDCGKRENVHLTSSGSEPIENNPLFSVSDKPVPKRLNLLQYSQIKQNIKDMNEYLQELEVEYGIIKKNERYSFEKENKINTDEYTIHMSQIEQSYLQAREQMQYKLKQLEEELALAELNETSGSGVMGGVESNLSTIQANQSSGPQVSAGKLAISGNGNGEKQEGSVVMGVASPSLSSLNAAAPSYASGTVGGSAGLASVVPLYGSVASSSLTSSSLSSSSGSSVEQGLVISSGAAAGVSGSAFSIEQGNMGINVNGPNRASLMGDVASSSSPSPSLSSLISSSSASPAIEGGALKLSGQQSVMMNASSSINSLNGTLVGDNLQQSGSTTETFPSLLVTQSSSSPSALVSTGRTGEVSQESSLHKRGPSSASSAFVDEASVMMPQKQTNTANAVSSSSLSSSVSVIQIPQLSAVVSSSSSRDTSDGSSRKSSSSSSSPSVLPSSASGSLVSESDSHEQARIIPSKEPELNAFHKGSGDEKALMHAILKQSENNTSSTSTIRSNADTSKEISAHVLSLSSLSSESLSPRSLRKEGQTEADTAQQATLMQQQQQQQQQYISALLQNSNELESTPKRASSSSSSASLSSLSSLGIGGDDNTGNDADDDTASSSSTRNSLLSSKSDNFEDGSISISSSAMIKHIYAFDDENEKGASGEGKQKGKSYAYELDQQKAQNDKNSSMYAYSYEDADDVQSEKEGDASNGGESGASTRRKKGLGFRSEDINSDKVDPLAKDKIIKKEKERGYCASSGCSIQ